MRKGGQRGRFQQFYRIFLLRLFHEGLGTPEVQRAPDLAALLGYAATFLMMLFDDESDTVVVSSGYTRFVNIRVGLLPDKRYELWVGCVTASGRLPAADDDR